MAEKRDYVCGFSNSLRSSRARSVAGTGFDADQSRLLAGLGGLQRGGELEAVSGHDAIVMVSRGDQRGGVLCAGLDVVQRRIAAQRLEIRGVLFGVAVIGYPGPADRELVEAEHVHHA